MPTIGLVNVRGRSDGNFGPDDFTSWPQWYHPSVPHLRFVLKKPESFSGSKILWLWDEVSLENKSAARSPGLKNSYRLHVAIANTCFDAAIQLCTKCLNLSKLRRLPELYPKLHTLSSNLSVLAIALRDADFTLRVLKYVFAVYRQYYQETKALFDYLNKWSVQMARLDKSVDEGMPLAEEELMGGFFFRPRSSHEICLSGHRYLGGLRGGGNLSNH